jgi:hypothetical protein
VRDFIAGLRGLPLETRNYVRAITGGPVEFWANSPEGQPSEGEKLEPQTELVTGTCAEIVTQLERAPRPVLVEFQPANLVAQPRRAANATLAEPDLV